LFQWYSVDSGLANTSPFRSVSDRERLRYVAEVVFVTASLFQWYARSHLDATHGDIPLVRAPESTPRKCLVKLLAGFSIHVFCANSHNCTAAPEEVRAGLEFTREQLDGISLVARAAATGAFVFLRKKPARGITIDPDESNSSNPITYGDALRECTGIADIGTRFAVIP
jgi:hypothetical protein